VPAASYERLSDQRNRVLLLPRNTIEGLFERRSRDVMLGVLVSARKPRPMKSRAAERRPARQWLVQSAQTELGRV
jgi:hypothetical protein